MTKFTPLANGRGWLNLDHVISLLPSESPGDDSVGCTAYVQAPDAPGSLMRFDLDYTLESVLKYAMSEADQQTYRLELEALQQGDTTP